MNTIHIVNTDDRSALYVNGKKVLIDDVIFADELNKYCPISEIKDDWTDKFDEFPETVEECMVLDSMLFVYPLQMKPLDIE